MRYFLVACILFSGYCASGQTVIRYNQLGYLPNAVKVVVAGSKNAGFALSNWYVLDVFSGKKVLEMPKDIPYDFGAYGPFLHSYRIDLSAIKKEGSYRLVVNEKIASGIIKVNENAFEGAADFCLRYMRQQRCGFNPFLKDSCHLYDGYSIYGEKFGVPDGTHFDAFGGWHDASDYLQYTTTSANAAYHLMMAWRDYPHAFTDTKQANGLDGKNGLPDVLDEAKWGLDWLQRMHPEPNIMFAQLADDRDHISMRMPKLDSQYGKGYERPLYFLTGEPQGLGKYQNKTEGTTSIAAKFSSAFALGAQIFGSHGNSGPEYAEALKEKAWSARKMALHKWGFTNTAPNRAPYYYAEENWPDDAELMDAALVNMGINDPLLITEMGAHPFATLERVTPWLGKDTAKHYQWYPFINVGHYELAKQLDDQWRDSVVGFYRQGIEAVWQKANKNAFYRGVPFIWCSNNLTTSFAMQCLWYRQLSGDAQYQALEQANIDWLFGCNPWGTSMVYGLPAWGDTPVDPHSAFTHLKNYPIDGGLIDGPVYTSIFKNLIGLTLYQLDEYADWQSDLAVYHDDYGDYSTNEPKMDGTASLIYLLSALAPKSNNDEPAFFRQNNTIDKGAVVRGDSLQKEVMLAFTAHEYGEGIEDILDALRRQQVKASFFLTGDFVRQYPEKVKALAAAGHYAGPHSDKHLLYAPWTNRDSLLVSRNSFQQDLIDNYSALAELGVKKENALWFLPPYEWYNDSIAAWTTELGIKIINHTASAGTAADYTTPNDRNYKSNEEIWKKLKAEATKSNGLNGYIILLHAGVAKDRPVPFYKQLGELIEWLTSNGYAISELR